MLCDMNAAVSNASNLPLQTNLPFDFTLRRCGSPCAHLLNDNRGQVHTCEVLETILVQILCQGRIATPKNQNAVRRIHVRSDEVLELTVVLEPVILLLTLKSGVPILIFKVLCIGIWQWVWVCHDADTSEVSVPAALISLMAIVWCPGLLVVQTAAEALAAAAPLLSLPAGATTRPPNASSKLCPDMVDCWNWQDPKPPGSVARPTVRQG